ncbi:MAG: PspC domain-containing protein [Blastochloris sp.]|nr:PspC domain-containing protein [Blastochloris sp.]
MNNSPTQRLLRSRTDKMLGGVSGGLGKYFGIDAVIVRIAFVLLCFFTSGLGLLIYLILWVIMPREPLVPGAPPQPGAATGTTAQPDEPFYAYTSATRRMRIDPMTGAPMPEGEEIPVHECHPQRR